MRSADKSRSQARQRIRRFAAAHLAAVLVLYAVALAMGGGYAAAPFPPDLPSHAKAAGMRASALPQVDEPQGAPTRSSDPLTVMHKTTDKPAPWWIDPDGRVHLRGD